MTEKKNLTEDATTYSDSKELTDEELNSVSGGTTCENAVVKVSFVGNDLTVSSNIIMEGVHIKINNLGIYSRQKNITSYTYNNVRRDAPVHYIVTAIYQDKSRKNIEFDNPTDPFVIEF